jgi:hypothetical protein
LSYRVRLLWADPSTRSGRREEIVAFADPRRALELLRRISETPERPLISVELEAFVRPKWTGVDVDYVRWRAAQRDRRDEIRRVMERRAAERDALADRAAAESRDGDAR